jgi:hypothetical protein
MVWSAGLKYVRVLGEVPAPPGPDRTSTVGIAGGHDRVWTFDGVGRPRRLPADERHLCHQPQTDGQASDRLPPRELGSLLSPESVILAGPLGRETGPGS